MENQGEYPRPLFKDIRRYYCEFCGICRSKKSLIASHIIANHEEEMKQKEMNKEDGAEKKLNVCEECGSIFQKPAHLKQHMQSHSLERPFTCSVDDCPSSFRRKDHLTRHLLQHQGKLFECLFPECKSRFTVQGNMARHVKEIHDGYVSPVEHHPKEHKCPEPGCGKVFKYLSKLQKHENSHVKLDSVEAYCAEPECMKYFSNEKCLKEHIRSCHRYVSCEKCGTKQLKKNIKRHIRMHEGDISTERIKCSFDGCSLTFSNPSNLSQHVKAVHFELVPFICHVTGCGMRFAFKHARDRHEKSGIHVFTPGDFQESDEQFRSRPRGGRKRKYPAVESLSRKRVVPVPPEISMNGQDSHPASPISQA
ncbi:transcription factor IIIA-like [Andrographis paniculata]|uniref:transcription factor IIIA-like n=1 Tax=Andrographis paniculata TaxID=175694 RepID=UPI0021E95DB6|nr:transcription factor IIIA-like [Andrographis paniculata]